MFFLFCFILEYIFFSFNNFPDLSKQKSPQTLFFTLLVGYKSKRASILFLFQKLFKFSKELAINFNISHDDICKIEKQGKFKFSNSIREKSLGNLFYTLKINKNNN